MSLIARVLQSMNYDEIYDPSTVAVINHISEKDAGNYLHQLAKGGGNRIG